MKYSKLSIQSTLSSRFLIVAIITVVVTMIITYYRNMKSQESVRWVTHTHEVIGTARNFLFELQSEETILHMWSINRDSIDIHSYRLIRNNIDSLLNKMRSLISDNPRQISLLNTQLLPAVQRLEQQWENDFKSKAPKNTNNRDRKIVVAQVISLVKKFITNEELLLTARIKNMKATFLFNDILRSTFLTTIGFGCLTAIYTIRKQQKINLALINNLEDANESLEERVKDRTEELLTKNHELNDSLEEIKILQFDLDQRNKKLEESLAEVQFLYDQAPCGYHTVDYNGIITQMNKTELEWLGYREEELLGKKNVSDILTPSSVEERNLLIQQLMKTGKLDNLEFVCVKKDGSTFPVLLNTIAYFDSNGKYLKNRSSMFDITQRKQLEEKLESANGYLIKINEEKDLFLRIATHDLKSPVNGILGLAQLLKRYNDKNEQLELIDLIESSALKMNDLIIKLLDLSRINRSDSVVKIENVEVASFLIKIKKSFDEIAKKKNIELILENKVSITTFQTDPSLLEQIIDNLVSNAIKFSPFYKKVWVRAKQADVGTLVFEVEDQGPGIKKEEIPKLFGTFQRLSARPTDNESSTGLGLSIVKEMAKKIKADITVNSDEGVGSVFSVEIPLTIQ